MTKMGHQVEAQQFFPFAGTQRKPGDIISAADWAKATDQVQHSLISQGYVRIVEPTAGTSKREKATATELNSDVVLLLQDISAKQDRILGGLAKAGYVEEAPAAAPEAPKKRKKK